MCNFAFLASVFAGGEKSKLPNQKNSSRLSRTDGWGRGSNDAANEGWVVAVPGGDEMPI